MTATQLAINGGPAIGTPGMEYDISFSDVVSKISTVAIPYGAYVVFDGNENCKLPTSDSEVTGRDGGIAMIDHANPSGQGYLANSAVRIMRRGRVFALNESTVAANSAVYVRHTATPPEQQGALRHDADGSDASIAPGARWFKGGTTGLAVLELGVGGSAGPTGATGATGATGPTGPTGPTA